LLFFQLSIQVHSNICLICQQAAECLMQRTMLAAVPAADERLITSPHFMQISAHLPFSYIKRVLTAL